MEAMDLSLRMLELSNQGYYCGQILLIVALEEEGKRAPELVAALGGLSGGLGFSGKNCGALTGGACLLAYLTAGDEGIFDGQAQVLVSEFVRWFEETIGTQYGGIDCDEILEGNPSHQLTRCAEVMEQVFEQCLLLAHREQMI